MRMMLKIKMPTELGNRKDGSLGRILEETVSKLKAEAAFSSRRMACVAR
jgi:hypothetical protein